MRSTPDVERFVRNDLMSAIAIGIDLAAINGSGESKQPRGILNTTGIGSVAGGTNGAAPTWQHVVELAAAVANENADEGKLGFILNSKTQAKFRTTLKNPAATDAGFVLTEGQTTPAGSPWYSSNNCPSNLTKRRHLLRQLRRPHLGIPGRRRGRDR